MHEEASQKMATARACALSRAPYFASIIYGFVYVPLEGIRTMLVTKGMVLGYDPEWAVMATIDELAADIAHEVNHVLRRTFDRAVGYSNHRLFGLAHDLAINYDLKEGGWKLAEGSPRGALFPDTYGFPGGKTAEEYYDLLQQLPDPPDMPGGGHVCAGNCGGISGTGDPNFEKQLDEREEGRSEVEVQAIQKRTASAIKQYFDKGRGNIPGHLQELIDATDLVSYVKWEEELGQVIYNAAGRIQAGGDDFSLTRPSKRSYMRGIIRPGMIEYKPEVAIVTDTSGSMGQEDLRRAAREGYAVLQALGIDDVWYCEADAAVTQDWQRVGPNFFHILNIHGRGGTDFRPAIEAAQRLVPAPDLLLYFTDGDGVAPEQAPIGIEVIWGIVPGRRVTPAPWGHTVFITDDPETRNRLQGT